ncbi:signaling lymphocytic activation molecule-like [Dicentrarchus labrax]|uniref:Ig-like domain-containing protein n=1 Tax=Dicentrarchus labrax TaxID=13489 RepID=A0A8C4HZ72_DICLA|nr:signaling lymphocytic activation molecule-like [Dicentrarchus labrax]
MDGGCFGYSIGFFTCGTLLLLLGAPLHDVEASSCQRVIIHKKVGDTVEFSSCLPTEGVTSANWKYGGLDITNNDKIYPQNQFQGRLELNPTNFSLTVRRLTLQDSGDFSFLSEVDDKDQRPTVVITLQVHDLITKQPILTINSTWHTLTNSCTVFLECKATSDSSANYNWTVRNQTLSGPRLQYTIRAQDGDTKFTCTSYNIVSEKSASKIVNCSNNLQEPVSSSSTIVPLIIGPVIGILLIILFPLLWYIKSEGLCCNRLTTQSQMVNQDETQQQVYSSLLHGDGSVYETIRGSEDAGTGGQPNQYRNVTSPISSKEIPGQ